MRTGLLALESQGELQRALWERVRVARVAHLAASAKLTMIFHECGGAFLGPEAVLELQNAAREQCVAVSAYAQAVRAFAHCVLKSEPPRPPRGGLATAAQIL